MIVSSIYIAIDIITLLQRLQAESTKGKPAASVMAALMDLTFYDRICI